MTARRKRLFPFDAAAACLAASPALFGCSGDAQKPAPAPLDERAPDRFDVSIGGLAADLQGEFDDGDLAFSTPMREADGLGPLYTRTSCDSCHSSGVRGPGLVQKMSVVDADGVTPAADQSELAFGHTVHPLTAGGGKTPILPPKDATNVLVTTRVGPPILGRGYMEAILDSEIERVASEQASRTDGIHGRVNHVTYASEANTDTRFHTHQKGDAVIGRFGLKARVPTLDDFAADAFQGDMGITSPLRPTEFPNPDGLTDDDKPGIDVSYESVNSRAMYVRLLEIPRRETTDAGAALFEDALCSACHVPSMKTSASYPVPALANVDAPIYSDLLLHDMGDSLADGLPASASVDGEASSRDWRTTPLIGLRFNRTLLHDGRAKTVEQAILGHQGDGSEANDAVDRFQAMSAEDREALLDFVKAL
ncbi:MAG TPA: di-heme oxidoredictase family protein [Polyangiaceae bacterium]|nr:di-heme oxidoredictase family protein [Polyangiaceae bacterium]